MEEKKLYVSSGPHIRGKESVSSLMLSVLLALLPALLAGVYLFGLRALWVVLVSVGSCELFEWGWCALTHRQNTLRDLSAAVTGLLLGLSLSPTVPLWLPPVGAFFAIVVVKQLYGGLGKNFLNPALAGRCFLFAWAPLMSSWAAPRCADAVSAATPLAVMKTLSLPPESLLSSFLGFKGGCIGEVSAAALLLGAAFLLLRGVIRLRIPLSYLLTVAVLTFLFPQGNERILWMSHQLLSGGLLLGAFFMATDYVTSPTTARGQLLYGVFCGVLTVLIRYFGSYPEGVSFSILIMNLLVWTLDRLHMRRVFGHGKEART